MKVTRTSKHTIMQPSSDKDKKFLDKIMQGSNTAAVSMKTDQEGMYLEIVSLNDEDAE